ncbi:putative quinol monooxygenase [Saxibacter everestensis]|uniref:Quinol monooxygenase n=1 Tax=Saxibacter everestensis TaxID=2909229 RepID=A0ABY8QZV7_9MICO|nr:putative quinol monooxygenase [Brevibacteriaceae bacterium ZFBP1038]
MSEPVVVIATFVPNPGELDRVRLALDIAIEQVHQEDGCELYAIHEAPNGNIIMIEKWESAELLDTHGAGVAVQDLNESLSGLLAEAVDVVRLTPLPVGSDGKGAL